MGGCVYELPADNFYRTNFCGVPKWAILAEDMPEITGPDGTLMRGIPLTEPLVEPVLQTWIAQLDLKICALNNTIGWDEYTAEIRLAFAEDKKDAFLDKALAHEWLSDVTLELHGTTTGE